jgi:hypothetical protein
MKIGQLLLYEKMIDSWQNHSLKRRPGGSNTICDTFKLYK